MKGAASMRILITSLGTGMYNDGYRETTYRFSDNTQFTEKHFLRAVLKHDRSINRVVVLGTRTSSWDVFAEHCFDAWERIKNECESEAGLRPESERTVEDCLAQDFPGIDFILKVHTPHLDRDTVENVLAVYNTIPEKIPEGSEIVFDITHGFRSMPLLIYQALQLDAEKIATCSVSLIYGEYNPSEKISLVRDLSAYWELSETAKAKHAFFKRLDGSALAPRLNDLWPRGGKAVARLSGIAACNFALQLPECLRQIDNALRAFPENAPLWVASIRDFLTEFHRRLDRETQHGTMFEYARLLAEMKLHTQAVIALQIAVELFIANGHEGAVGDYDWWQTIGRNNLNEAKRRLPLDTAESITRLGDLRNQIAHGGYRNAWGGEGFPQAENLPAILARVFPAVNQLFSLQG